MDRNYMENAGRTLEEAFFAKQDRERIEKLRREHQAAEEKEALAKAAGIADEGVIEALHKLGLSPETLAALSLVPLVEVAWADGTLDNKERAAILETVAKEGMSSDSASYALLESWLDEKPPPKVRHAWKDYTAALAQSLGEEARKKLKQEVLDKARKVAAASGGFVGIGSISGDEKIVLDDLEKAFG